MPKGIDLELLAKRLQKTRTDRGLTLQNVSSETGISVATLSRIEREALRSLRSDTLITLTEWMQRDVHALEKEPRPVLQKGKVVERTPDIVELHLRADPNLDRETADALANLFRTVYKQLSEQLKKKE